MIEIIDNFFRWLKSATFVSDLIIRLVVVVIVGGLSIMGWFISIPILAWYFYKKFGNARISGCRCRSCNIMNDCNDKFCINCGSSLAATHQQRTYSEPQQNYRNGCQCKNCNTNNDCNDKFCINCGSKLDSTESKMYEEILHSVDGIVVALLAKIAKADGRISQGEADYLSHVFDILAEKRDDRANAKTIYKEILKQEKDKTNNLDKFCEMLSHINTPKDLKIEIVKIFLELAYVDGMYDKNEENIIVKIVHHLDLEFSIYQDLKKQFEPKQESKSQNSTSSNLSLDECYKVLESNKTDSMDIIKKNYRRLVKQYHYDSMASKDLPQEMLKFAEEKTKVINEAYEKIKKSRG